MTKIVFPAALACLFCFPAAAGEISYDISGKTDLLYGYSDVSRRYEDLQKENTLEGVASFSASAEYQFNEDYSAVVYLDVMAATDKEVQDYNNGSWGKQISADLNTPFGQLSAGEMRNAAAALAVGAPEAGIFSLNNSEIVNFIANPNWHRRNGEYTSFKTLNSTEMNTDGAALKFSYFTPQIYNTILGVSYVSDTENRRGLVNNHARYARDDAYVIGLYHGTDLGFMSVEASLGYGIYHKNDKEFSGGLKLSRGNWSVGGSYRKTYVDGNDYDITEQNLSKQMPAWFDNYREGQAWNVGIGYQFGPYKASLGYFEAKAERTDNRDRIFMLNNDFQLNKNVNLYATAAHVDFQGENKEISENRKGFAFVAGIGLSF